MTDPPGTDPADRDPRERGLSRRSGNPTLSPWLIIAAIVLTAVLVYVASALF